MALNSLRLRRTLTTASSVFNHHRGALSSIPKPPRSSPHLLRTASSSLSSLFANRSIQCRQFRSSAASFAPPRTYNKDTEEITPDTILFEGCDYNHWLITMDFPKDPRPSAEEMVDTYVKTLAKGLNISIEEAMKKMYACSTTTYNGFQAVMTEEESEKFRGLPGVVFILPDSYIDPVNKEYGGDKYENGKITPRPPPVQYGRQGGRYGDRNRNFDRSPRYDRQGGPMPNRQGGDGRNYGPPPNYGPPRQNLGPPQQNYGTPQQNYGPPRQNYGPPQQNYSPPQQNYGPPQQNYSPPQQNYGPPQQNYSPPQQNYGPPQQNYGPPQQNYGSPQQNHGPPSQNFNSPGQGGSYGQAGGNYGQGVSESHGQGASDIYGPGAVRSQGHGVGEPFGPGSGTGSGQGYPGHGIGENFSQVEQRSGLQGEHQNYTPVGQTRMDGV